MFPITNVIYIELGMGRSRMVELHGALNHGSVGYREPFPYHPHVTLAQEISGEAVGELTHKAKKLWETFRHSRIFPVHELTFVQNTKDNSWIDLATVQLDGEKVPVRR